jgi:hypothetical protein
VFHWEKRFAVRQKRVQNKPCKTNHLRRQCTFHFPVPAAPEGMLINVQYSFLSRLTVSAASEREMPAGKAKSPAIVVLKMNSSFSLSAATCWQWQLLYHCCTHFIRHSRKKAVKSAVGKLRMALGLFCVCEIHKSNWKRIGARRKRNQETIRETRVLIFHWCAHRTERERRVHFRCSSLQTNRKRHCANDVFL